eukprot:359854-Chlamydomonas_euryale.AAC.2
MAVCNRVNPVNAAQHEACMHARLHACVTCGMHTCMRAWHEAYMHARPCAALCGMHACMKAPPMRHACMASMRGSGLSVLRLVLICRGVG